MGYNISYHPISEAEMHEWLFDLDFMEIKSLNFAPIKSLGKKYGLDDCVVNKYIDTIRATPHFSNKATFDKTHGYVMAIVQGFYRTYYYTRNCPFSFLIKKKPYFQTYTKSWEDILQQQYPNPVTNKIEENYSAGVYIPHQSVCRLMKDYQNDEQTRNDLECFFGDNISVFINALRFAQIEELGILEASEVIRPNPMNDFDSICYSNIFNCDRDGLILYHQHIVNKLKVEAREKEAKGELANTTDYKQDIKNQASRWQRAIRDIFPSKTTSRTLTKGHL